MHICEYCSTLTYWHSLLLYGCSGNPDSEYTVIFANSPQLKYPRSQWSHHGSHPKAFQRMGTVQFVHMIEPWIHAHSTHTLVPSLLLLHIGAILYLACFPSASISARQACLAEMEAEGKHARYRIAPMWSSSSDGTSVCVLCAWIHGSIMCTNCTVPILWKAFGCDPWCDHWLRGYFNCGEFANITVYSESGLPLHPYNNKECQ
jgi:hypothetical protein